MKRFCDQPDERLQASRSDKARGFDHRGTQILPCPEVVSNLSKLSLKISCYNRYGLGIEASNIHGNPSMGGLNSNHQAHPANA